MSGIPAGAPPSSIGIAPRVSVATRGLYPPPGECLCDSRIAASAARSSVDRAGRSGRTRICKEERQMLARALALAAIGCALAVTAALADGNPAGKARPEA